MVWNCVPLASRVATKVKQIFYDLLPSASSARYMSYRCELQGYIVVKMKFQMTALCSGRDNLLKDGMVLYLFRPNHQLGWNISLWDLMLR
jgi:hypothetical protein